jgi:hypothetical protein
LYLPDKNKKHPEPVSFNPLQGQNRDSYSKMIFHLHSPSAGHYTEIVKHLGEQMEVSDWYHVSFDENKIYIDVRAPERNPWKEEIEWKDIIRICYKAQDFLFTDEIYIFSNKREQSYLIPVEADGGFELWNEIIRRGLFDAKLAIKIATADEGLFCWPPDDDKKP